MKAAILRQIGRLDIEDVELNGPGPDEVRLRVAASGLCHSDYHIITGDLPGTPRPALLGHEGAGLVEAVGENVRGIRRGDFVTTSVAQFCGHCRQCQTGHNHLCDLPPYAADDGTPRSQLTASGEPIYRLVGLGSFAEEMVVHHRAVAKLPDGVPPEVAAVMGCAVLTGVGSVLNGAKVEPGATVAVIGCGGVGLNVIQGARIAGASRIIAVDLVPSKLELARAFGATDALLSGSDIAKEVIELTGGGVDYAFEVIGLPTTMAAAFAMLCKRGTAVLIGVAKAGTSVTLPTFPFMFRETKVIGAFMGSSPFQYFLPQLARYYLDGRLMLDELISERIALSQINEGYARMAVGEVARSVVMF
jgi:S-(hydroxymethyl)glutathione dehydrogenase/alcohol dehydrogenase